MNSQTLSAALIIQTAFLASKLSKRMSHHLSVHGINLSEYLIMHYLNESPNKARSRIELAELVSMSASGVTRLLAPMEKNKLVQKEASARDARQRLVKLSKSGERIFQETRVSFEHSSMSMLEKLSEGQQNKLMEIYSKLL